MSCDCTCLDCIAGRHCGGHEGPCTEPPEGIWSDEFNDEFYDLDEWEPEFVGTKLPCGLVVHVSKDVQPETLDALNKLGEAALKAYERGDL